MILETKLSLPQPKAGALLRTGLIEQIKNNLDKKLILITADAGYGKTTLLGQLVKEARLPAVFYHLDKGDSDLLTFYTYLLAGLEILSPGLTARSAVLLQPGAPANDYESLPGTLINELSEKRHEELFIILDDYQHLSDGNLVDKALEYFIEHMPETAHVILSSRNAVQFASLSRWIAKQDAYEVTRSNLSFSEVEIRELLAKASDHTLGGEELKQVMQYTEGWITGIQLVLSQSIGTGKKLVDADLLGNLKTEQSLCRYFMNEILSGESARAKYFLTSSSILERLSVEACNAVLEADDSGMLLLDLERRNMFISYLGRGEYRYHRLFRDFLQQQLKQAESRSLNNKAARYFMKSGDMVSAIEHYLEAGEYEQVVAAVIDMADQDMVIFISQLGLVESWLQRLPQSLVENEPILLFVKGRIRQAQGNLQEARSFYFRSEQLLKKAIIVNGQAGRLRSSFYQAKCLLGQGELLLMSGQYQEALTMLRKSLNVCPRTGGAIRGGILNSLGLLCQAIGDGRKAIYYFTKARQNNEETREQPQVFVESNIALQYYKQGEIKTACDLYDSIIERNQYKYFLTIGVIYANAANAALIAGYTVWAEKRLAEGLELCRMYDDIRSRAALENSLGALCAYQGQWETGEQHLQKAVVEFKKSNWAHAEAKAYLNLLRLYRYAGNKSKTGEYASVANKMEPVVDKVLSMGLQIERAFYEMDCGNYKSVVAMLKTIGRQARHQKYHLEEFLALLGRAAVDLRQGRKKAASALAFSAVGLSRRKGYDGLLTLELRHNRDLAALALRSRFEQAYLSRLKQRIIGSGSVVKDQHKLRAHFFGLLRISSPDGREIPVKWRSRKAASLFAYLLLNKNRYCEREELINALWPETGIKRAGHNLNAWIFELKKDLSSGLRQAGETDLAGSPVIGHKDKAYGLINGSIFWTDAEEFENRWNQARSAEAAGEEAESAGLYRSCVELYREGFLSNLGERWCEEHRDRFQKIFLSGLLKLAGYCTKQGNYEEAIACYRRYLDKDPFAEEVRMELWAALQAAGRRAEIQKDYTGFYRMLKKELDLEPMEKTKQRFSQLMEEQ